MQTSEERERFGFLCEEKVKVVLERNEIVDQLEEERVQHQRDEATDTGYDDDNEETQRSSSETSDGKCSVYMYNNYMLYLSIHAPYLFINR